MRYAGHHISVPWDLFFASFSLPGDAMLTRTLIATLCSCALTLPLLASPEPSPTPPLAPPAPSEPAPPTSPSTAFHPGDRWLDNHNLPINAHGGGILLHDGFFYWYGEHKISGAA